LQQAKDESYKANIQEQIVLLKRYTQVQKQQDLQAFAAEIKQILQEEIIARYYCQEGAIEAMLVHDPSVQSACMLFQDMSQYDGLLQVAE